MSGSFISTVLATTESILCVAALASILLRRQGKLYKFLCVFLGVHVGSDCILLPLLTFAGHGIEAHLAYKLYFYTYWSSFTVMSIFGLLLINSIFNTAMAPLDGLKTLGVLVFRWVASISLVVALGSVLVPHLNQFVFIVNFVTQLQRTQSILTLCLLLFVCFAIKPLGLTYRSRLFGVNLGLGIFATTNLVTSAWMAHFKQLDSTVNVVNNIANCFALILWTAYFALPEPKRRIIVLPTTSPFLRWNQISEVLGDAPGFVAIAGIPPELFAPAELEVMRRASVKMAGQPITTLRQAQIS